MSYTKGLLEREAKLGRPVYVALSVPAKWAPG